MKRSNITNLLLILMFLAGVSLLLYPSISDYWNSFHSSKAISNYVQKVDEITEEDYERMIAEVKDYNKSLLQRNNPYALTDEMQRQYDSLLNLDGTGVMGYVEIPVIDCSIPVYHTVEERVLQKAIGHLSWTSLPMGGKDTHCALSGHRGLPNAKFFSDMDKIVEGDRFYLYILNEELVYEVDQILIVNPEETKDLLIVSGKDYCTLVTCTPYGVNTHRLLVRGKRIENDNKSKVKVTSEALQVEPLIVATVLAVPMLLLLLIWLFIPKSKKDIEVIHMMRIYRKIAIWLTVCMMVFVYAPYTVLASTDIDQQKDVSLTIEYVHDTTPVEGVEFEIFFVAEVHGYGKYELAGDFEKYPVQLEEMDTAKWRALARTLIYYVQEDKIQPTDRGVTDAEGRLTFPSEGLSMNPGLYLVNAEPVKGEQYTYYTEPLLVSLPGIDQETDEWEYDVTVNPKFEAEENEKFPLDSTFNQQVMKIWEEDVKEVRPEEVTIKLLENGNLYDSVILNDENNWSYEWQNIPKYDGNGVKIDWGIIEEEVADYTVTISKERDMYIVTNTYAPGIQIGDTLNKEVVKVWDDKGNEKKRPDEIEISLLKNGEIYDTQVIDSTDDWKFEWENLPSTDSEGNEIDWSVQEKAVDGYRPSIVEKGNVIIITNSLIRPTLPQTGLLWWPVPVLIMAGLIFLIVGKVIYGTNKK